MKAQGAFVGRLLDFGGFVLGLARPVKTVRDFFADAHADAKAQGLPGIRAPRRPLAVWVARER